MDPRTGQTGQTQTAYTDVTANGWQVSALGLTDFRNSDWWCGRVSERCGPGAIPFPRLCHGAQTALLILVISAYVHRANAVPFGILPWGCCPVMERCSKGSPAENFGTDLTGAVLSGSRFDGAGFVENVSMDRGRPRIRIRTYVNYPANGAGWFEGCTIRLPWGVSFTITRSGQKVHRAYGVRTPCR